MDPTSAPQSRQRSPWFYALLGCGGLAGLICLGTAIFFGVIAKGVKDASDGVTDAETRQKNALAQLGALPEGYSVTASMSLYGLMKTTVLTDRPPLPDGGFDQGGRLFTYFRIVANDNTRKVRDYFSGKTTDPQALSASGVNIDTKDILKRGTLTVDGRPLAFVVSRGKRGQEDTSGSALLTAFFFDCPDDALRVGIWIQSDPNPEAAADALDLSGTVGDEAAMLPFLKPMNPCGK